MADIISFCNQIHQLTDAAIADLLANLTTKNYKKGEYLFKEGKICEHLYFINEGLAKCFFYNENTDKEFVIGFLKENAMFSLYDSFAYQTISKFNLIALENSNVTRIRLDEMEKLCEKYHSVESMYRKLITKTMTGMMNIISDMIENNTTERYNNFVEKHGDTMQRISLSDVAKLFGITQQSLSRIRTSK
jgi:CRP-like cAMP-binding protein